MSLSDLLHEWRHQRRLAVMGWNRRVEPEEEAWCEDCGSSREFCSCPYNEPYKEEDAEDTD